MLSGAPCTPQGYGRSCNRYGRKASPARRCNERFRFVLPTRRRSAGVPTRTHADAHTHTHTPAAAAARSCTHTHITHPPAQRMHMHTHPHHAPLQRTHLLTLTQSVPLTHSHCSGVHSAQVNKVDKLVFGKDPTDDARGRAPNKTANFHCGASARLITLKPPSAQIRSRAEIQSSKRSQSAAWLRRAWCECGRTAGVAPLTEKNLNIHTPDAHAAAVMNADEKWETASHASLRSVMSRASVESIKQV